MIICILSFALINCKIWTHFSKDSLRTSACRGESCPKANVFKSSALIKIISISANCRLWHSHLQWLDQYRLIMDCVFLEKSQLFWQSWIIFFVKIVRNDFRLVILDIFFHLSLASRWCKALIKSTFLCAPEALALTTVFNWLVRCWKVGTWFYAVLSSSWKFEISWAHVKPLLIYLVHFARIFLLLCTLFHNAVSLLKFTIT